MGVTGVQCIVTAVGAIITSQQRVNSCTQINCSRSRSSEHAGGPVHIAACWTGAHRSMLVDRCALDTDLACNSQSYRAVLLVVNIMGHGAQTCTSASYTSDLACRAPCAPINTSDLYDSYVCTTRTRCEEHPLRASLLPYYIYIYIYYIKIGGDPNQGMLQRDYNAAVPSQRYCV